MVVVVVMMVVVVGVGVHPPGQGRRVTPWPLKKQKTNQQNVLMCFFSKNNKTKNKNKNNKTPKCF